MAIIKCPECNHEVSNLAPQCPFCGVPIVDNIVPCPDCGKIVLKQEHACPNCGCELLPPEQATQKGKKDTYYKYPTPKHTRSGSGSGSWIIWVIALLVVLALSVFGYLYVTTTLRQKAMQEAYEALNGNTHLDDFNEFLSKYPDSPFFESVTARRDSLQLESDEWLRIRFSSDKENFVNYLTRFPKSLNVAACNARIDSLDWIEALTEGTDASLAGYLEEHSEGKFAAQANEVKTSLTKNRPNQDERNAVKASVNQYLTTYVSNSRGSLLPLFTNQNYAEQVASEMSAQHEKAPVKSLDLVSGVNISKTTAEAPYYIAKFKVKQQHENPAENKSQYFDINAVITSDMHILHIRKNLGKAPYVPKPESNVENEPSEVTSSSVAVQE